MQYRHGKISFRQIVYPMPRVDIYGIKMSVTPGVAADAECAIRMARFAANELAVDLSYTTFYREYFQNENIDDVRRIIQSIAYRREPIRIGPLTKAKSAVVARTLLGVPAYIGFRMSYARAIPAIERGRVIAHEMTHHYGAEDYIYALETTDRLKTYNREHTATKPASNNADSLSYFMRDLFVFNQRTCESSTENWTYRVLSDSKDD
jgi:hypothetical protein